MLLQLVYEGLHANIIQNDAVGIHALDCQIADLKGTQGTLLHCDALMHCYIAFFQCIGFPNLLQVAVWAFGWQATWEMSEIYCLSF